MFPSLTGRAYTLPPVLASLHAVVHWPRQGGYNFVSGPLADITLATGFIAWVLSSSAITAVPFRVAGRLEWHPHPDNGHPVCRHHHPDGAKI